MPLIDKFGRQIYDLRVSVTDRCNFRCVYCRSADPENYRDRNEILTWAELDRLAAVFVGLGIRKVRVTGGEPLDGPGYFYEPTVLADVPARARVLREEIFGPVAPIATFSTEAEAIEAANATEYGLVAYLYTRDLSRTFRVSEAIEAGMIGVNQGIVSNPAAPFGGVKQSGFGREGGFEGIDEYLETKYVALSI